MEENKKKMVKRTIKEVGTVSTEAHDIFTLVTKNGVVLIALADKIISTKQFTSEKAASEYIDSKPWELIINATVVCMDILNNQKKK